MRNAAISLLIVWGIAFCGIAGGADFVPSDIAGLQVWFDAADLSGLGIGSNPAGGTAVGTWADLSASGLDATQANAARQPIYRSTVAALGYMPAVDFNGSIDQLQTAAFSSANARSVFVVTAPKVAPSPLGYEWVVGQLVDGGPYKTDDAWGIGQSPRPGTKFRALWRGGGNNSMEHSTTFSAHTPYILNYVSDSTTTFYVNDDPVSRVAGPHNTRTLPLTIGGYSPSPNYPYNGHIAEVIVYDTALGAADRAEVQNYLAQKYMTAPLYYDLFPDPGLQGGSRTWNGTNVLWSSNTAGSDHVAWTEGANAVFHSGIASGPFTVTVGEDAHPGFVHVNRGGITFTNGGGRIVMSGGMIIDGGGSDFITINSGVLAGTGGLIFDRAGSSNQRIYGDQSFTGQVQLVDGTVRVTSLADFGQNSSFGQGTEGTPILLGSPGTTGAIWIDSGTHATNRTFHLAEGGTGSIGTLGGQVSLNGIISGGSDTSMMLFGMQGTGVFSVNAQNTYSGETRISGHPTNNQGVVRLGIDNALPTTTTVHLGNVAHTGYFDLNGNDQELAGLVKASTSTASNSLISVFNTSASQSTLTLDIASGTNTYVGSIGRSGGNNLALVKTGEGILELSGANTYSGHTTISEGILSIATTGALPGWDTAGRYTVAGGATLAVHNAVSNPNVATMLGTGNFASGSSIGFDTTSGNRSYTTVLADLDGGSTSIGLTKLGPNNLTVSGANTYTGPTIISNGLMLATALADFGEASSLGKGTEGTPVLLGSAGSGRGGIWYSGSDVATNRTFRLAEGGVGYIGTLHASIALDGVIDGGSETSLMQFNSQGSTKVMTLGAQNTYLGATEISGAWTDNHGYVQLGVDNALPATTTLHLGNKTGSSEYAGLFNLNGFDQELAGLVRSTGVATRAINVYNSSATQSILTLNIASGTNTYEGVIGRAGGNNLALVKTGEGVLELSGANTYTGATAVRNGTLRIGADNALPTSTTVTLGLDGSANTALLDLNGFNQQLAGLARTGLAAAETNVFNSDTSTESTLTLTGGNFAGVIGRDGGDNLGLTKIGTAQLQLSGANTYTGATVISAGNIRAGVLADFGSPSTFGRGTAGTPIVLGSAGGNQGSIWYTGGNVAINRTFHVADGGSGSIGAASGSITLNGAVEGGSAASNMRFSSQGSSTMTLNAANTYEGTTHIYGHHTGNNGIVRLGIDNALPTTTSLSLGFVSGSNQYTGLLDLNGFHQELTGLVRYAGATGPYINVFNSNATTQSTLTLNIASGTNTYDGLIGRDGGDHLGLTKTGAGRLDLLGANTYAGATTIAEGVLAANSLANFGEPSSLGQGTAGTPVILGSPGGVQGVLWYTGGAVATDRTFRMAAGGHGSIRSQAADVTLNGAIDGGSTTSRMQFSAQGTGTMTLNAANTYLGATHIYGARNADAGVVRLGLENALPTSTIVNLGLNSGGNPYSGLLDLNGFHQQLAGLTRESGSTSPNINVYNTSAAQSTLTLNIASGTNTYSGVLGRTGGDNLALVKTGEGALELSGANTYTGTTTVEAGLLSVPGSLANMGPADVLIHSAGTAFGANDPRIALAVGNGAGYGMGSAIAGGDFATTAELLGGTAGADRTVAMAWRQGTGGGEGELISDVLSLEGTGDDTYVLQMSYNANWGASAYLAWLDGDQWINAIAGNTGGTPTFFDAAYDAGDHFTLGYYGVDTTNHLAWAVLNHNSQFAVVPEPGSVLMLLAGGAALGVLRRKRRTLRRDRAGLPGFKR